MHLDDVADPDILPGQRHQRPILNDVRHAVVDLQGTCARIANRLTSNMLCRVDNSLHE